MLSLTSQQNPSGRCAPAQRRGQVQETGVVRCLGVASWLGGRVRVGTGWLGRGHLDVVLLPPSASAPALCLLVLLRRLIVRLDRDETKTKRLRLERPRALSKASRHSICSRASPVTAPRPSPASQRGSRGRQTVSLAGEPRMHVVVTCMSKTPASVLPERRRCRRWSCSAAWPERPARARVPGAALDAPVVHIVAQPHAGSSRPPRRHCPVVAPAEGASTARPQFTVMVKGEPRRLAACWRGATYIRYLPAAPISNCWCA